MTDKISFVEDLNKRFKDANPEDVIKYCAEIFSDKIVFTTSFGAEDQVATHIIGSLKIPVKIVTLDTGRLFPETYDVWYKTESRYGIRIQCFSPKSETVEKMINEKGINLFYDSIDNRKQCCYVRKIEPLQRALKGMDTWVTGLRREQSVTRKGLEMLEWDDENKIIKINPLISWDEQNIWDYIRENKVPYNMLHDKNYPSIGCQPCTRAIMEGEDARAGRWWWEHPHQKECGLHKNNV